MSLISPSIKTWLRSTADDLAGNYVIFLVKEETKRRTGVTQRRKKRVDEGAISQRKENVTR